MSTWAVLRYDHAGGFTIASGVFTSPEAAMGMAAEWGDFSGGWPHGEPRWQECGEEALVTADWLASTNQATFYVASVPLHAGGNWRSALEALRLLARELGGISRKRSRR